MRRPPVARRRRRDHADVAPRALRPRGVGALGPRAGEDHDAIAAIERAVGGRSLRRSSIGSSIVSYEGSVSATYSCRWTLTWPIGVPRRIALAGELVIGQRVDAGGIELDPHLGL